MKFEFYKDFYQSIFSHSADGVLLTAPDGQILAANPAACRMLGRTEKELCKLGRSDVVDTDDPHLATALAERARNGVARAELTLIRGDGSRFPAEITATVFHDGNGSPQTSVIIRDNSQRRQLEQEREQYVRFFQLSTDPMCIADPFGCFKHVNQAFATLTGYTADELVSRPFLDFVLPEDRQKTMDEMKLQVAVRPSLHFENRYVCKNGRVLLLSWTAYFDKTDNVTYATARDISAQRELEEKNRRISDILRCVRHINEHLLVAREESELYQFVCNTLSGVDRIVGAWIGLKASESMIQPVASAGFDITLLQALQDGQGQGAEPWAPTRRALHERQPVMASNAEAHGASPALHEAATRLAVETVVSVPIQVEDDVIGAMVIWSAHPVSASDESLRFFVEVAGDIAVGVRSLRLSRQLATTLESLHDALMATVEAIAKLVETRDPYTAGHEHRVAELASAIGLRMGLPAQSIEGLRVIGHLHDLGKISIPAEILSKPTRLSAIEMELVQSHPEVGYEILKGLEFPWPVAQAVLQHHERLDGSGYPNQLQGDAISLEARIIAVADTVEAMSTHRPYRPARGLAAALAEITSHRGQLYDPAVVDACVAVLKDNPLQLPE